MTQVMEPTAPEATGPADDLVAAIQRVLQASSEPLTVSKIRTKLPAQQRDANLEEVLSRQVAAKVLYQYPKYRSQQDRFWDRPMEVHVADLLVQVLQDSALALSELRRKLPTYAQVQVEAVLQDQLNRGRLFRHPRTGGRSHERFGARPADAKDYLLPELKKLFGRLEALGFTPSQLRSGALELLHEEEWSSQATVEQVQPARAEEPAEEEQPPPSRAEDRPAPAQPQSLPPEGGSPPA